MDFYKIKSRLITTGPNKGTTEIYPDFRVCRSKDLMIRGRSFYAIWDERAGLWSTDEYDVQRLVDEELWDYMKTVKEETEGQISLKLLSDFSSNSWLQFRNYIGHLSDSSTQLDEVLTFSNTDVKKNDFVSRRLPYPLEAGSIAAWDEIAGTLYSPEERAKFEWAFGAIISGDAKSIQKFLVFYGKGGTGKSTIMNIAQMLFEGYYTTFEAKALVGSSNAFSTEVFKSNPLVAIQHDGDLSKIEDNTKLNSIVSHEDMTLNEKYKPSYMARINAFLLMGTNKPVKITDAKSGLIRRLIDVRPTGDLLSEKRYQTLMAQIPFELGAIAHHCLGTYRKMGKDFYSGYRPVEMMLQTDVFYNFIEAHFDLFKSQNGTTLKQAYDLYKTWSEDTLVDWKMPQYKFREELKNYFGAFHERFDLPDSTRVRSWFSDFQANHFKTQPKKDEQVFSLVMDEVVSLLDDILKDLPAQYSTEDGTPRRKWADVTTTTSDLDTSQEHYTKVPPNHIVIDFDLKDENGVKSLERNLEAASQWPATYAEFSKGGAGIHLHYEYGGDVSELARLYEEDIEIKVFQGDSSLRRRLSRCNNVPVAVINSGLPLREKKMLNHDKVKSEMGIRDLIMRNLRKEIHPGTKPSVDFIHKILEDAYSSGVQYDVTDLRQKILAFANNSTNQPLQSLKLVQSMQFRSQDVLENLTPDELPEDEKLVIFDCEVYPNLFVVCWKYQGSDVVVPMINPTPQQIEELLTMKLVGFNCRKYDNHILYGRLMGFSNEQLYQLSQKIISNSPNAYFGEAYNISYADILEFSSKKQSLKKFQVELGITHMESELPWDEPVAEEDIPRVVEYCTNDVNSTEATFEARKADFVARQILADLSGLSINSTTQQHTSRIVFGNDKKPQSKFKYTNLSEMFPGYSYSFGKSTYRDEVAGEGGYVYAEPGIYENVALLDVASMHPTSIEQLELFGPDYTKNFSELKEARIAIKHKDFEAAKKMLGGKLTRHLTDEETADALSYALKIVINIVYGLTAAKFDNSFRDPRNIDNIVAKRGALFMIDLRHAVQDQGFQVAHIKTDSIKIPNATPEIIEFVKEFGANYGYEFEHEATYEKMFLANDAVYIAKVGWAEKASKIGTWEAVGAQFQHPYVFKSIFSKQPIKFEDLIETKSTTTALYLVFNEENHFVGKVGSFVPLLPGTGGGLLMRQGTEKLMAATGTKGYEWHEASVVKQLGWEDKIDMRYYEKLAEAAQDAISNFGDYEWFAERGDTEEVASAGEQIAVDAFKHEGLGTIHVTAA